MQVINGTSYNGQACRQLANQLERARLDHARVRIFLGDSKTGKDWLEEHDVTGTIGRSMGPVKVPILLHNSRSLGGAGMLEDCIVKLMVAGVVTWTHPKYNIPKLMVSGRGVYADGKIHARLRNRKQAQRLVDFLTGKRMGK